MSLNILVVPKFSKGQMVGFIGGAGIIKNYRPESSSWVYLVEMPMGPEPEMGKVGYETMIWLAEEDISTLVKLRILDLSSSTVKESHSPEVTFSHLKPIRKKI